MIELRQTTPADLAGLGDLFAERFGHRLSPEAWAWKYRSLPGEGLSTVAVDDGRVVAHVGAVALASRWAEGEAPVWQLVDFVAARRGKALRPPLIPLLRELFAAVPRPGDAPWLFAFPSPRNYRLGERLFDYRPLTTVPVWSGPLPAADSAAAIDLESSDRCAPEAGPPPAAGTADRAPDRADADWADAVWRTSGALGVRRSAAFLNWRYHARPERYYRFYRFRSPGPGFAVFAFVGEEAIAAETWLPPGASWAVDALRAVAADLRASGLRSWRFWPFAAGGVGRGTLADLGLTITGEVFVGIRKSDRPGAPDPLTAARGFTLSQGDHDLV